MNAAVIVAAGRGARMGLERNKVLYPLCGEPIVVRTARAFAASGRFDGGIVVVTGACDLDEMKRMLSGGNHRHSRRRKAAGHARGDPAHD